MKKVSIGLNTFKPGKKKTSLKYQNKKINFPDLFYTHVTRHTKLYL